MDLLDRLTEAHLSELCSAPIMNARMYFEPLRDAMRRFEINTVTRIAAFTATIAVESTNLTAVEEGLYYTDAERLAKLFRRVFDKDKDGKISQTEIDNAANYTRMPKLLSIALYNGYHGRGLIQLTWEENYRKFGKLLGFDYVAEPGLVKQPLHAALTACAFWSVNGCNEVAADMREVTLKVNGKALMHLDRREAQFAKNVWYLANV